MVYIKTGAPEYLYYEHYYDARQISEKSENKWNEIKTL